MTFILGQMCVCVWKFKIQDAPILSPDLGLYFLVNLRLESPSFPGGLGGHDIAQYRQNLFEIKRSRGVEFRQVKFIGGQMCGGEGGLKSKTRRFCHLILRCFPR